MPGPSLLSSTTQQSSARNSVPNTISQPQQPPLPPKPNYDPFSSLTGSHVSSRSTTPGPTPSTQPQQLMQPSSTTSDPFAKLSSPAPKQASPFPANQQPQNSASLPSASIFDFANAKPPSATQQAANSTSYQTTNGTTTDDDWNFASALPDEATLPSANDLIVSDSPVNIHFHVTRAGSGDSIVQIGAKFSNKTTHLITEYTFQVAVTKVSFSLLESASYL